MDRTRRALLGAWAVAAVVVTGCAAGPSVREPDPSSPSSSTPSSSTPSSSTPAPGLALADAGFTHAPPGFTIPGEVSITRRVDQPNVVTALFSAADGRAVLEHLTAHLAAMGFTIEASGGDSLVFSNADWDGAFTISPEISGLSLRRKTR